MVPTDRPDLDRAREYTRRIGPHALRIGATITLYAIAMLFTSEYGLYTIAYGVIMFLFGYAALARTESRGGRIAQWGVTFTFVAGGIWSLMQWIPLIWGPHHQPLQQNLSLIALWLTAGPALFVPGVLAAIRPGWTPLIVVPALLSLAVAGSVGFAILRMNAPEPDDNSLMMVASFLPMLVAISSLEFLVRAGYHAVRVLRS
jgi:hypothetical protein